MPRLRPPKPWTSRRSQSYVICLAFALLFFLMCFFFLSIGSSWLALIVFCIGLAYFVPLLWFPFRANDAWVYGFDIDKERCHKLARSIETYLKHKSLPYERKYYVHGDDGPSSGKLSGDRWFDYHFAVTMIDGSEIKIEVKHVSLERGRKVRESGALIIDGINKGNRDGIEMGLHVEMLRMLGGVGVGWGR